MAPTASRTLRRHDSAQDSKNGQSSKALPVTLLSGFLGAGKTTLLQHILRADHGLRIAVIVNDIGAINIDANLIRNTHSVQMTEKNLITMENGCLCCTLRGDLLEELVRLSELAEFDYIIIESSGISEPEQVAETFDKRLVEQIEAVGDAGPEGLDEQTLVTLRRIQDLGGLENFARLDTTCTVIDAFTMFHDFETADLLSSRRDDVTSEDERAVSDLMVDQIEFADVVVLNKVDMVDAETLSRVRSLVTKLNHRAKIIECSHGRINVKQILNTGLFDLERAKTGYGWLQDLHDMTVRQVNGRNTVTPKPETEEYNIRNFVYSRHRPFHPRRLYELIYDKFILQHEEEDEDEDEDRDEEEMEMDAPESYNQGSAADSDMDTDSDPDAKSDLSPAQPPTATILATKRTSALFSRLFRSKGEFWLATRPYAAGEWSQAGAILTLRGGRPWFAVTPAEEYLTGNPDIDALVAHDLNRGGVYGDRRQELVFIGEDLDVVGLERVLDQCLLTEDEWDRFGAVMRSGDGVNGVGKREVREKERELCELFEDGFPDWPAAGLEHNHAVGEECGQDA